MAERDCGGMMRSRITVAAALFLITGAVNLQIPLY
jgi:hypothetical protein